MEYTLFVSMSLYAVVVSPVLLDMLTWKNSIMSLVFVISVSFWTIAVAQLLYSS